MSRLMVLERAAVCRLTGMWIRLKLMAPFHRPRAARRPFLREAPSSSSAPSPPCFLRLAMAALRLHQRGLARHGGPADFLAQGRTLLSSGRLEVDPLAAGNRFVDGLDDGHVDESFFTG